MSLPFPQALFLDRDGTLIKWVHYLHEPSKVRLEPGISQSLSLAKQKGCRLFLHTNQSGVGRGYFGLSDVHAVNDEMFAQMKVEADFFDAICIAPDSPEAPDSPSYRKPDPRFELEMIERFGLDKSSCYMLGDNESDLETGRRAGIRSVHIHGDRSPLPSAIGAPSVSEFIRSLLEQR